MDEKIVDITRTIHTGPNVLDSSIVKTIIHLFRQKYENTCDEKDGFIIGIDKISNLSNVIGRDSCHIQFTATLRARVIKPEKGLALSFSPSLIVQKGIFGKLYDTISIFVPESYMKEWTFNNDCFTKDSDHIIQKQKPLRVVVMDIKFNNTKYNCICKLL
jgi:DNA-directed RNA polymerase subunit E'/Rpb7